MTQKFLIVPTADLDGNTQPTTLANAFLDDASISGLTNDAPYRAFALNNFSGIFTPVAAASFGAPLAVTQVISTDTSNTTFTSSSITPAAGSNRCAVLFVSWATGTAGGIVSLSATWGSSSFTSVAANFLTASSRPGSAMFFLKNADIPSTAQTITLTLGVAGGAINAQLVEFAGVNQTTPLSTASTATSVSSETTQSITRNMTATDSLMLSMGAVRATAADFVSVSQGTVMFSAGSNNIFNAGTRQLVGATGNNTHTYTWAGSGTRSAIAVEMFRA